MAKRTAIIDIGSNSVRMVVVERTSRYGFFLLHETKSRVRISEGAYENSGNLQPMAMERAFRALREFLLIAKNYKARKTLCVATSALRDAPNQTEFTKRIHNELGLNIKVIDGPQEAYYGGVSVANLMPHDDGITIDIGGGSTEFALVQNKKVVKTASLNLGTVRLKELFFDKKASIEDARAFVLKALQTLDPEFRHTQAIGIGGTIRAISKAVMLRSEHPLKKIHSFNFDLTQQMDYLSQITQTHVLKLKKLGIKTDRLDTIRPGALILVEALKHIGAEELASSGVGVREGVFLCDLLRSSGHRFPANFNPSVRSLQDRFCLDKELASAIATTAIHLFDILQPAFDLPKTHREHLEIAAKLSIVGLVLDFYSFHRHSAYILMNDLEYGFSHDEMILIATLVRYHKKKLPKEKYYDQYASLLPPMKTLQWLSFILTLAEFIHTNKECATVRASYHTGVLAIDVPFPTYLASEQIKAIEKPAPIAIKLRRTVRNEATV